MSTIIKDKLMKLQMVEVNLSLQYKNERKRYCKRKLGEPQFKRSASEKEYDFHKALKLGTNH